MFGTLLGALPRPPLPADASPEAILDAILRVQVEADLEPLTDGGWPLDPDPVAAWRSTSGRTDHLVKAVVHGPFTTGRPIEAVRATVLDLAQAGCRWIEVHEPAATTIGGDAPARTRFADAHRTLTTGLEGVHVSLAITGGSADGAGIETILAGAYASLAIDLIDGPDNWHLAAAAPADRGIVCGALSTRAESDDGPEVLLWAAGYAASTRARGHERVGIATAGSLVHLPWEVAVRKVERLGHAVRLGALPAEERKAAIDPRAVDLRSAALGRYTPAASRRSRKSRKSSSPGD
jgi:hypothetical protein